MKNNSNALRDIAGGENSSFALVMFESTWILFTLRYTRSQSLDHPSVEKLDDGALGDF